MPNKTLIQIPVVRNDLINLRVMINDTIVVHYQTRDVVGNFIRENELTYNLTPIEIGKFTSVISNIISATNQKEGT